MYARKDKMHGQLPLFAAPASLPEGFRYQPDLISADEERMLVERIEDLPFKEFEFHGFLGKRRVVAFGWKYDYGERTLRRSDDIPDFLEPLREKAARFAGQPASALQQALVTGYGPGVSIGWHRDKPVFGEVIGVSLLSACVFRLRKKTGTTWQRSSLTVEPRSAYLLKGPSRTDWEHSIPSVERLRYSVTFRNFKAG
jgi:alkylated DNA repair dioxygenase AlkB